MYLFLESRLACENLISSKLCLFWENVCLPLLIGTVLGVLTFASMSSSMIFFSSRTKEGQGTGVFSKIPDKDPASKVQIPQHTLSKTFWSVLQRKMAHKHRTYCFMGAHVLIF